MYQHDDDDDDHDGLDDGLVCLHCSGLLLRAGIRLPVREEEAGYRRQSVRSSLSHTVRNEFRDLYCNFFFFPLTRIPWQEVTQ